MVARGRRAIFYPSAGSAEATQLNKGEFFAGLSKMLSASHGRAVNIDDDTDLLESGIVDSKTMVDILMYGEDISGATIDVGEIDVAVFAKAKLLYELFFGSGADLRTSLDAP